MQTGRADRQAGGLAGGPADEPAGRRSLLLSSASQGALWKIWEAPWRTVENFQNLENLLERASIVEAFVLQTDRSMRVSRT